jgi:hypothetical protein
MSTTPNLTLPFLAPGQAQKHVTLNEALGRLDALVHIVAVSAATSAQPASPADGACWILPAGKTGSAWASMAPGALACWRDGAWREIAPREGWMAFVADVDALMIHTGGGWVATLGLAGGALSLLSGGVERARLATSGELLVGAAAPFATTNSATATTPQVQVLATGSAASMMAARFSADVNPPRVFFAKSRGAATGAHGAVLDGDRLGEFSFGGSDGTKVRQAALIGVRVGAPGAHADYVRGNIILSTSDGASVPVDRWAVAFDGTFVPWTDNAYSLGSASFRAAQVYAATGAINTSDAREKTPVQPTPAALKRAAARIRASIGVYQWLDAVAAKGAEGARLHVGVTAQAVRDAFAAEGLDPWRYGLLCADPLTDRIEVEPAREAIDADTGEPILIPARCEDRPTLDAAGAPRLRLGVRADQLALLLAAT